MLKINILYKLTSFKSCSQERERYVRGFVIFHYLKSVADTFKKKDDRIKHKQEIYGPHG